MAEEPREAPKAEDPPKEEEKKEPKDEDAKKLEREKKKKEEERRKRNQERLQNPKIQRSAKSSHLPAITTSQMSSAPSETGAREALAHRGRRIHQQLRISFHSTRETRGPTQQA